MVSDIERATKWNKDNADYRREYMRNYRNTHIKYFRDYYTKYRQTHKKQLLNNYHHWVRTNQYKENVEAKIQRLNLIMENCACCNASKNIHAHHENYDVWNCIIFLCGTCHQKIHMGVL